jgi:hypothetical protein
MLIDVEELAEWIKENAQNYMQYVEPYGCDDSKYFDEDGMIRYMKADFSYKDKWAGMPDYIEKARVERGAEHHTHVRLEYDFSVEITENVDEIAKGCTEVIDAYLKDNKVKP